jgi:hypothetical protein
MAEEPVSQTPSTAPTQAEYQRDQMHAGQRRVNLIWEVTQAVVALIIVLCNMGMFILIGWQAANNKIVTMPEGLTDAMFIIIGFYFGRTNHSATGGVGAKAAPPEYVGR